MKTVFIVFVLILSGLAGIFFWQQKNISQKMVYKGPVDTVHVQLKVFHQAQFAGMYVAKEKGMYGENGIEVNFIPYTGSKQPIEVLQSGEAQFAVMGADEVIEARTMGIPVKAVAVVYKISPVSAYTLKTSGITKPQDFIGKKVGIAPLKNIQMMYGIAMAKIGVKRNEIKEMPMGYDATELLNGTVDVATGFSINEPYQVQKSGKEPRVFLLADYGARFYNDVIVTMDKTIQDNPSLVRRFVGATIAGWEFAIKNPAQAVEATLVYAKDKDADSQTFMLDKSIPLIRTGGEPIGIMKESEWQKLLQAIGSTLPVGAVYTNDFVSSLYK